MPTPSPSGTWRSSLSSMTSSGRRRKDQSLVDVAESLGQRSQTNDGGVPTRSRQLDFGGDDVQPMEEPPAAEDPAPTRPRRMTANSFLERGLLRRGVAKYGVGKWKKILIDDQGVFLRHRTNVDLKDKWKNLQIPRDTSRKRRRKEGDTPSGATTNGERSSVQVAPRRAVKQRRAIADETSELSSHESVDMRPRRQAAVAAERADRALLGAAEEGERQRSVFELKLATDLSFPERVPVTINLNTCRDVSTLIECLRSSVLSHASVDAEAEFIGLKSRALYEDNEPLSRCIRENGLEFFIVLDESPEEFV